MLHAKETIGGEGRKKEKETTGTNLSDPSKIATTSNPELDERLK